MFLKNKNLFNSIFLQKFINKIIVKGKKTKSFYKIIKTFKNLKKKN